MNKHLLILSVTLVFCLNTISALGQKRGSDRDRFVGAWKLFALERPGPRGECCGMFVFTKDGHLSVQVMDRDSKAQTRKCRS